MPEVELKEKLDQNLEEAAKFFVFQELNIPYYFGFNNLTKISNYNIEQFLGLSSELFEEMLSAKIAGKNIIISATTQEKRIKRVIGKYWSKFERRLPDGSLVKKFLENFSEYARKETFKVISPIIQGVTGFSIGLSRQKQLFRQPHWYNNEYYEPLLNIISTCIANNLLERREVVQGPKVKKIKYFI